MFNLIYSGTPKEKVIKNTEDVLLSSRIRIILYIKPGGKSRLAIECDSAHAPTDITNEYLHLFINDRPNVRQQHQTIYNNI